MEMNFVSKISFKGIYSYTNHPRHQLDVYTSLRSQESISCLFGKWSIIYRRVCGCNDQQYILNRAWNMAHSFDTSWRCYVGGVLMNYSWVTHQNLIYHCGWQTNIPSTMSHEPKSWNISRHSTDDPCCVYKYTNVLQTFENIPFICYPDSLDT